MASTFNLLTAGGARFDKSRFKRDIDLFDKSSSPGQKSRKGKERALPVDKDLPSNLDIFNDHPHHAAPRPETNAAPSDDEGSGSESDASSSSSRPAPPAQKITLKGDEPLPASLSAELASLTSHATSQTAESSVRPLLTALKNANIHSLWGVQCAVAGCLLEDRDVMCIAPTGSGKTLSYLLPTIIRLGEPARNLKDGEEGKGIRAVVVVPTHDLAIQIKAVSKAVMRGRSWRCLVLSKATEKAVCESAPGKRFESGSKAGTAEDKAGSGSSDDDGAKDGKQAEDGDEEDDDESTASVNEFAQDAESSDDEDVDVAETSASLGLDLLIATPERLHHLLQTKQLSLSTTRHIILDESDRLLSADFRPQVDPILKACSHPQVQKCFLSATMPAGSEQLAQKWLRGGGVRVVVGVKDSAVTTVDQSLLYTGSESGKILALRNLVSSGDLPYPSLIFVQSVARADELHKTLVLDGVRADVVHGNRAKSKRDEAIKAFREGKVWMLVVTEVLARGMDFRGVKVVVNYDFPQTVQSYIHRIGRTGRAGRPGKAITFFSNEDSPHLRTIANVLKASGCPVPAYMLDMPKPSKNLRKERAKAPVKRKEVGGGGRDVAREQGRKKRDMIEASKRRKLKE